MAVTSVADLQPLASVSARLRALLDYARDVKPETTVEPPLPTSEFVEGVKLLHYSIDESYDKVYRWSTVETAAREVFYSLVNSLDIDDPGFVEVWNLLDITLLGGDEGMCGPALVCLLIEELLDSLTTDGCRTAFTYCESRREKIAQNHFDSKERVLLRFCNELLRRLSRAEDAILCGRVFFFLFQTFPLGDRSSVNLRAEFHVENTTKFEVSESQTEQNSDKMEVDAELAKTETATPKAGTPQPPSKPGSKAVPIKASPKKVEEDVISNSELYPIFWKLQQDFSDPNRLFAVDHFQRFKKGLAYTISKFKHTPTVVQTKSAENDKRGTKRKLGQDGSMDMNGDVENNDHFVDNYNPKYLTSRDLFDLELSDLAFQRHILVQALILIDYLLSLTDKAQKRLAALPSINKSMIKEFTLSEEDSKWASSTRATITNYLSGTQEGKLFNRMVETVLVRDKNWVRWKVESCPSIVRDPVSAASELEARKGAKDATRVRRVPERPPGSMDLSFLDEGSGGGLEALKNPDRYSQPSIDEMLESIKTDELDLEMAMGDDETEGLKNAIANKRWRILRQARRTRLGVLDKVEPGKDLETVFHPPPPPDAEVEAVEAEVVVEQVDDIADVVVAEPEAVATESEAVVAESEGVVHDEVDKNAPDVAVTEMEVEVEVVEPPGMEAEASNAVDVT